jgi:hypothetical protein
MPSFFGVSFFLSILGPVPWHDGVVGRLGATLDGPNNKRGLPSFPGPPSPLGALEVWMPLTDTSTRLLQNKILISHYMTTFEAKDL